MGVIAGIGLGFVLSPPPVFAQDQPSEKARPTPYGAEIDVSSGYVYRGLVISDRPVVQAETSVSGRVGTLSVWTNITLAETSDGARPQILDVELTRAHHWGKLTIEPGLEAFHYHDPLSIDTALSMEGSVSLSYQAGPFRLLTSHSVDVLAYRGAYFGEAGIEVDRRVSQRVKAEGSFNTGWASSTFNDAYIDVAKSAFNFVGVEAALTAYLKPRFYFRPHFQFSTIVDRALRAELARPTLFTVGLAVGVEF